MALRDLANPRRPSVERTGSLFWSLDYLLLRFFRHLVVSLQFLFQIHTFPLTLGVLSSLILP
jgi:hypothetical protein